MASGLRKKTEEEAGTQSKKTENIFNIFQVSITHSTFSNWEHRYASNLALMSEVVRIRCLPPVHTSAAATGHSYDNCPVKQTDDCREPIPSSILFYQ